MAIGKEQGKKKKKTQKAAMPGRGTNNSEL